MAATLPDSKLLVGYWIADTGTFDNPPLRNMQCYVKQDGSPQINVAVLSAATFNGTPDNFARPYFSWNDQMQAVLDSGDVQALQAAGIKVTLSIFGHTAETGEGMGWSSIPPTKNDDFAAWIASDVIEKYGLDGIDIDDEYSPSPPGPAVADTIQAIRSRLPSIVISKALFNDEASFAGTQLGEYLTYGATMEYGDSEEELEGVAKFYTKWLKPENICIGVDAGPVGQPGQAWTSTTTAGNVARWTVKNGYQGIMLWSFSQDIQEFTHFPQHQFRFPYDKDHEWQKAIVENMWGEGSFVVKPDCRKAS